MHRETDNDKSSARAALLAGMRDTFPLLVGAAPFGLIFGALAMASGLSAWGAAAMSALVFAGSSQFIAVGLIAAGTPVLVIALTTLVVNLRHMLYSATLAPKLKGLPLRWLLPLGFWLTDESFVVAAKQFDEQPQDPHNRWYLLGSELAMYTNWQLATWVGILAGSQIRDPQSWGLDYAMVVTFLGMLVPMLKGRPMLAAALVAGGTALLAQGLPHQLGLMLAALLGVTAGVLAERVWPPQAAEAS
ncbi:MAG: AzlC family ABC transporter permease [Anaerolineales bacterium]|nr:AzlC family ABC transporter permease [Anaerolineales bacterium]MCW5854881.1 AzlC family ABC transporter permease [Anaerolineales bacterium]